MRAFKFFLAVAIAAVVIDPHDLEAGEKGKEFLGKTLPKNLHHPDAYLIRDLFVEDVPGTKSYWLGPWVETVAVNGVERFYMIKGYNRFYINAAFLGDSHLTFLTRSTGIYDFYGPFEGKPSDHFKLPAKQGGSDQPATAPESESKREENHKLQSQGRPPVAGGRH